MTINFRDIRDHSINKCKTLLTTCASNIYDYSGRALQAVDNRVAPHVPIIVRCVETAAIVVIAGVALRTLVQLTYPLPIVESLAALIIARYAVDSSNQYTQAAALFAIGAIVMRTLTISACSLPVLKALIVCVAAVAIAKHMTN